MKSKLLQKTLTLLLAFAVVFTFMPFADMANSTAWADAPGTVIVKVAPKTVNVEFFTDKDATKKVSDEKVKDDGIINNFHQYTITVTSETSITYRGTDDKTNLGGETFTVNTVDKEAQKVNLLRANIYYDGASLNIEGDYTFTLKNGETEVVYGTPYITSNKRYTPTLLIAGEAHTGTTALADQWKEEYYLTGEGKISTTPSKTATSATAVKLPISAYKIIKVTAPTAATTTFYKQDANYVVEPVKPNSTATDAKAGTTTYIFKDETAHSNYQFRSMMDGNMTQAGYLADGNDINVSFDDDPYSTASDMEFDDKSVLLNIPNTEGTMLGQNKLCLGVGETFKLRAFRAAWEIINTTAGNQMIEPDFHAKILSGDDVVKITPTMECSNTKFPNAQNGNATKNWMNVEALNKGTAIVAVWYDAINVFNANPPAGNDWAVFGAADPARYGVFVVSVGDDTGITWNPASHDGDWDAEFDTVYYCGNSGNFTFKPTEDVTAVTVQNVYGTTLSSATDILASDDGSYSVPVTNGANIVAVTTASGTDYQIVRAKEIKYTITNKTTGVSKVNGAPDISTEDVVEISFDKLDMPIPKMSGIYNPGVNGTCKTAYELNNIMLNNSMLLTSAGTQYNFSINNSITFKAHVAGENNLKGYISLFNTGDPFGNHRGINDEGKPVNMNAVEVFGDFGVLPDIKFTVTDSGKKTSYEEATKIEKFSVLAGLSRFSCAFEWNEAQNKEAAWNKTEAELSSFGLIANVSAKDYNNIITFRYWYDGEEIKSVQLKSGIATTIPKTDFALNPNKVLHLQVEIRPVDTSLGAPITYNYLAFPGNSSSALSYVHPFIKSLTAEAGGEKLVMKPMLNTVDTEYTLCVGNAETITLSAVQLVGLYNTANTGDKSDKVTLSKMKKGSAVGEPVTVLESGLANNPNRAWTYSDLDISDSDVDALQIVVTSYFDESIARSYTFKLDRTAGSENENDKDARAVDALIDDIGEVTLESEGKVTAAREAYDALAPEQQALVTKLSTLTAAESALAELKKPPLPPIGDDDNDTITVTFRLIGSTKASSYVDLSKGTEGYNGAEYVTWIPTKSFKLKKGSTVKDLFTAALDEAGLSYDGADSGYVSSVKAPLSLGGYALSDSDNGSFCGWMYTVNGSHSNLGLKEQVLSNGDKVIWHYVNDYRYEVSDWFDGSVGSSLQQDRWNSAEDKLGGKVAQTGTPAENKPAGPTVTKSTDSSVTAQATAEVKVTGGTAKATVDSKTATELVKQAKDNKATEVKLEVKAADTKNAKAIQAELPKSALSDIAGKTDAALVLATPQGEVKLDNKVLDEIAKAAAGTNVTIEIKAAAPTLEQTNTIGKSAQVIELTITSGSKTIGEFNGGTATFASELPKALDGKRTAAVCIKADGTLEVLPSKVVEVSGKKHIEFTTSHFSTFAIVDADEAGISEEQITQAGKKNEKLIAGVNATKMTAKSSITKNSKGKKAIKISWIQSKGYKVDYYEVWKSTKKNSGYKKLYTTADSKKKSLVTSKNLKKGKTYYFKVRGVRMIDGKKYYTKWSSKVSKTYK